MCVMAAGTGIERAIERLARPFKRLWAGFEQRHPVWVVCLLVPPGVALVAFGFWWARRPSGWEGTEGPAWVIPFICGLGLVIASAPSVRRIRRGADVTSEVADAAAE